MDCETAVMPASTLPTSSEPSAMFAVQRKLFLKHIRPGRYCHGATNATNVKRTILSNTKLSSVS